MFVEGIREKARVGFDSWLQQETDSERICCVTGPLGSGKTTLAAEFCGVEPDGDGTRDVKKQRREGEEGTRLITAFHFFQDGGNFALNKCWVEIGRQLAGQLGYDIRGDVSTEEDGLFVFRRLVAEPLTRLSKPSNKIVVLVDGVDKLPWATRESFWEIVSQTWERETPMWVHLAVFSYTTLRLSGAIRWIDLQDENHEKDIELLCNARLASFMQDEEDVQYATKHIVRHSTEQPSVLLYTSCVLDALLEGRSHRSVTLDDIWEMEWRPECLVHAFRPYLINFLDHVIDGDMDQYQQLLSCLSAARTPLSIDVAAEVLEMNNESLTTLLSKSTSLVYQEDDAIMFAHPCLKNVVQQRRCDMYPDGIPLHVNERRGHEWLATFLQNSPTSPLALRDMFYHLCLSRKWSVVPKYLLDFDWVLALVSEEGCALKLIEDADKLYNDKPCSDVCVTDVVRTIDLGLEAILADSALLMQQIFGRIPDETHPIRRSFDKSLFAQTERAKRIFLPVTQTLLPARSTFRKQLRIDGLPVGIDVHDDRFVVLKHGAVIWDSRCDIVIRTLPGVYIYFDEQINGFHATRKRKEQGERYMEEFIECFDWRFKKLLARSEPGFYGAKHPAFCGNHFACIVSYPVMYQLEDGEEEECTGTMLKVYALQDNRCLQSIVTSEHLLCPSALQLDNDFVCVIGQPKESHSFSDASRAIVWNWKTGDMLLSIECSKRIKNREVELYGDRLFLLDAVPKVWNINSCQVEFELPANTLGANLVRSVYFSNNEIRHLETGHILAYAWSEPMFLSNETTWVSSGSMSGTMVYKYTRDEVRQRATKWPSSWHCSQFLGGRVCHLDGSVALSSNGRSIAKLWRTETGQLLQTYDCSEWMDDFRNVAAVNHQYVVCLGEASKTLIVWDRVDATTYLVRVQAKYFHSLGFTTGENGEDLLVAATHYSIHEMDPKTGDILADYELDGVYVQNVLPGRCILGSTDPDKRSCVIVAYPTGTVIRELDWSLYHTEVSGDAIFKIDEDRIYLQNWRTGGRMRADWTGFASGNDVEPEALSWPILSKRGSFSKLHVGTKAIYIALGDCPSPLTIYRLTVKK